MPEFAKLTVTSGPDRGRTFDLEEELVHIGSGPENQVALSDDSVAQHQASIVSRGGRYAIFTPTADAVDVDGDAIPADQWVWLPAEARIKIGKRTAVLFNSPNDGAAPPAATERKTDAPTKRRPPDPKRASKSDTVDPFADDDAPDAPNDPNDSIDSPERGKGRKNGKRRRRRGKPEKPAGEKRQVARFVTDQTGDTVVTLGEDGQLPELKLRDGARSKERRADKPRDEQEGTSPVIYVVLAISLLSTVALLLLDFTPGQTSRRQRQLARQELRQFIGNSDEPPEAYQAHIRDAMLALQRGDFAAERESYRRVLDLLNAEDNNDFLGLTGNPERDERLRELVGTLLAR